MGQGLTLAAISMLAPLMLWGLGMLSVPIIAHLINRRARHRIVFPSLRLLQASSATQSALFRLRRLILLVLRCLLAALIVLAFARPLWTEGPRPVAGEHDGAGTVILLDASVSTTRRVGGVPLADSIRAGAAALDALDPGTDLADVVVATARPRAFFGQLVPNLNALAGDLAAVEPTWERADLPAALDLAGRLLASVRGERRLVIVSDLQSTNWADLVDGGRGADLLPDRTAITVVEIDAPRSGNVGLSTPRSFPVQPVAGQPLSLSVRVTNYDEGETPVRVDLELDGEPAGTRTAVLGPWESRDVAFDMSIAGDGRHEAVFTTDADDLEADDAAFFVVNVARRVPVVVVGDDDPDEAGSGAYFLTRALAPRGDDSDPFEVRFTGSRAIEPEILRGAAAVVVGDIGWLEPAAAAALREHVRLGGGLIWLCGNGPVAENLARIETHGDEREAVFPWRAGWVRDLGSAGGSIRITTGSWRTGGLRVFDEQSQLALSRIRITRLWTAAELRPGARVLLGYADGTPALASSVFGSGRVLLGNFSPATEGGDLGKYGAFVALLQSLVVQVQPTRSAFDEPVVGPPCRVVLDPAASSGLDERARREVMLVGPGGEAIEGLELLGDETALAAHVPRTTVPGIYRLVSDGRDLATVAVNVDQRESDPRPSSARVVAAGFGQGGRTPDVAGVSTAGPLLRRDGKELWSWCAIGALVLIGLELSPSGSGDAEVLELAAMILWRPVGPTLNIWAGAAVVAALAVFACWRTFSIRPRLSVATLVMRLLLIGALTVVLFGPSAVPPERRDERRPRLTVLVDTSQSMLTDDCGMATRIGFLQEHWLGPARLRSLDRDYEIELFGFNDRARPLSRRTLAEDPESVATGRTTRLADALAQTLLRIPGGDGGGRSILVLSDGRDTDDAPIQPAVDLAQARTIPVHTVCLGSATNQHDLAVFAVPAQSQLMVDEPGELVVKAYQAGLPGASTTLHVRRGDDVQRIPVDFAGGQVVEVSVPVVEDEPGQYEYTVWLEPHREELELGNNAQTAFFDVTDERISVLLLEGQPYWDTKFIAQALRKDDRIELTQITQLTSRKQERIVTRVDDGSTGVPGVAADFAAHDVIIIGHALENVLDERSAALLSEYVSRHGGNVIFARGRAYGDSLAAQRVGEAIFDLEPVVWGEEVMEDLDLTLTAAGSTSAWLSSTSMGVRVESAIDRLPGFELMPSIERTKVAAIVLAEAQPAGGGPGSGRRPAIVTMRAGRGHVAAVLGEGLWRWSLLQREHRELAGFYDTFWSNLVRWLAMGGDLQPGQDVSLKLGRSSAWVGDEVLLDVVYRMSPAEGAHLTVTVTDPEGRRVEVPMRRLPGRDPRFRASIAAQMTGVYRVALHTPGQTPEEQQRAFSVHDVNLERLQSAAAPGPMRALAEATGGVSFEPFESERFLETLDRQRLSMIVPTDPEYIWDKGLLLFSMLAWAGLEWLVRRRGGLL